MFNENRLVYQKRAPGETFAGPEAVKDLAMDFKNILKKIKGEEFAILENTDKQDRVITAWLMKPIDRGGKGLSKKKAKETAKRIRKWINKQKEKASLKKMGG